MYSIWSNAIMSHGGLLGSKNGNNRIPTIDMDTLLCIIGLCQQAPCPLKGTTNTETHTHTVTFIPSWTPKKYSILKGPTLA